MDIRAWAAIALLTMAALAGAVEVPGTNPSVVESEEPSLVDLQNESQIWPYTSRAASFDSRTLAVNVLVYASPGQTYWVLTREAPTEWEEAPPDAGEERVDEARWGEASGATRYTYVEYGGEGEWLVERYQLAVGDYLGSRMHVRAYGRIGGNWTALQAHNEYWDWFRLRHTVTDVSKAQAAVETDLERGADANVFEPERPPPLGVLLSGLVIAAVTARVRRRVRGYNALQAAPALATGGTYLAVRALGIAAERAVPVLPPKVIAAVLYPVIAFGVPILAYAATRWSTDHEHDPLEAFAVAAAGLALALAIDAVAMGATVLSTRVLLHRAAVVLAVGLVAAAGADEGPHWVIGGGLWVLALAAPLAGLV